ncbi:AAA family ATPase [Enterovibrio sp. ZSDZ42]|uniref:AAA family ATPase n=2 Tax=Enterovibrio gelatinilyticus TaxID=2899819 RepID=A0ABT5R6M3_9GAMM|nr:AAA family ATPase [Enterovibrio sp. ZSDZ42]MDD1795923.1 AAA family ATPase [Enterovibrio sp. ZSDZ42]
MTGSQDMIALDLDSQIQLLSRIQFLTRFSSNLVQVTGEPGAGKTWLSERYLENWANEPTQSLLICNPSQQDAQHRAIILRQIVRDGVFNEQDSMLQSLEYMLEGRSVHALVVIDDAQRLSANIIAELWALVTESQQRDGWQINVLLFSLKGKLNKWLHKVSYGQGVKPLELEVSPLADNEREMFIEVMMVSRQLDASQRRALKQKAASLPSLPGALRGLEQQETSLMEEKKRRSPLPLLILVLLLLAIGGGIVWWSMMPQTHQEEVVDMPDGVKALADILEEKEQEIAAQTNGDASMSGELKDSSVVLDDTMALPDTLVVEGMTVGRRDQDRRIVVPDNVVDAIMDDQQIGGDGTNAVAEPLIPELAQPESVPMSESAETPPTMTDAVVSQDVVTAVNKPSTTQPTTQASTQDKPVATDVPMANQLLLTVPKARYALQLAALQSKTAVSEFLDQYALQGRALVYETRRNGESWYMVLLGDYPTVAEARRAELALSADVRGLNPWAKSFTQIHKEIGLVN